MNKEQQIMIHEILKQNTILTEDMANEKWTKCIVHLLVTHQIRNHPELTRDVHPYLIEKLDSE